jgi:hypothetical protein
MIVNIRLEVTDEQRSALSLRLHPSSPKRLATRKEFNQYVDKAMDELSQPERSESVSAPSPVDREIGDLRNYRAAMDEAAKSGRGMHVQAIELPERDPRDEIRPALHSINNAMFSMSNASRSLANADFHDLLEKVEALRAEIVAFHDKEFYSEHG